MTEANSPQIPKSPYYFGVDSLRGLAALGVVLFHVRIDLWVGWNEMRAHPQLYSSFDHFMALLSIPMAFGSSGVMLFFLLSGFCIHLPNAHRPTLEIKTYFARRLLRIYPPYLAILLISIGLELLMRNRAVFEHSTNATILRSLFLVQNYANPVKQVPLNNSLWSLPVEIEMYLLYPLLWWLWRKKGAWLPWLVVSVTSATAMALSISRGWPQIPRDFALFWAIWFAGAFLAQKAAENKLPVWKTWYWLWPALIGSLGAAATLKGHESAPWMYWCWALFYFPLLWWSLERVPKSQMLKKALTWLGRISFSLYLVHWPFFRTSGWLWTAYFGNRPANLLIPLLFVGLSLIIAELFYRCIELPSHRLARNWGKAKTSVV